MINRAGADDAQTYEVMLYDASLLIREWPMVAMHKRE